MAVAVNLLTIIITNPSTQRQNNYHRTKINYSLISMTSNTKLYSKSHINRNSPSYHKLSMSMITYLLNPKTTIKTTIINSLQPKTTSNRWKRSHNVKNNNKSPNPNSNPPLKIPLKSKPHKKYMPWETSPFSILTTYSYCSKSWTEKKTKSNISIVVTVKTKELKKKHKATWLIVTKTKRKRDYKKSDLNHKIMRTQVRMKWAKRN